MNMIVAHERGISRIPGWVRDLASFRRWAMSEEFPTRGWFAHLGGKLWVDPSLETMGHNSVRVEIASVLCALAREQAGDCFLSGSRMLLTNLEVDLCLEPDSMFVGRAALAEQRVRLPLGADSVELEGAPDMVLEVVSPTSWEKDTVLLRELYWRAGITEYWVIDPRRNDLIFDILRRGPNGYTAARRAGGWVKSSVFGKSFRLSRENDPLSLAVYTLHVR